MGQHLAKLALLTTTLGGCSWLFDPDRLAPAADAPPPPINLFPCAMTVTGLAPTTIVEGMGAGGSRPALIVISGQNLVNENTRVTITAVAGSTRTPLMTIDDAKLDVGSRGEQLSLSIALPVDPVLRAGETIALDVKVEQDCIEGRVSGTIPGMLKLKGLDELTSAAMLLQGGVREFSQINVLTGTATNPGGTSPVVLRSMSSVKIASDISVDANGKTGGPAGGTGGVGGTGLSGVGAPGTGPMPGMASGNSGGFDNSDPGLNTLSNPNRSSGGAGGDAGLALARGGDGGGGGGSIEITAGGDLQVAAITAHGAVGQPGQNGGAAGGSGSGGVIILRAGGTLMAGNIDVRSLGSGARGRARYDAGGMATVKGGEFGSDHLRGPMFSELPFAFHKAKPDFMVVGKPLSGFKYFFLKQGGGVSSVSDALFNGDGTAKVVLSDELEPGANQICLITEAGMPTSETRNCAYIGYLR
jgi:hypothetical protein